MVAVDELLEPVPGDEPTGPDLSAGDAYARIEQAYRDADVSPSVSPTGAAEEPATDFSGVVEDATDFLRGESKDLKIAALLTGALLREEGFEGLAGGLELCRGLLEEYWDGLHPGVGGRAAVLTWLGSEDVALALYQRSFTSAGHNYFHYKEWAQGEDDSGDDGGADEGEGGGFADELSGGNFGQSFALTPREWYEELCAALHRCGDALSALEELGEEKFGETDERPPRYRDLSDSLRRVTAAAEDLLERKPAPPPGAREKASDGAADDGEAGEEGPGAGRAPAGRAPASIEDPEAAAAAIATSARVLRAADAANPAPYLLLRGFRWGELRAYGEEPEPRALAAPSTEQRTRLKSLFLDQEWETLLESAEEVMATPAGRGWLDLQRYTVLAAERRGGEHRHVARAVKGALRSLLHDVPTLVEASLMDDSAAASRDTLTWLESQGLVPGSEGAAEEEGGVDDVDAERAIREASFDRAAGLVRAGDAQSAIELLMERAEHESSQRARFIVKAEVAGIMVEHGMKPVARPILDELHRLIDAHDLESWEPGEIVAKPLGLLYRCLSSTDGALREQLYQRLAKLDPMMAMKVSEEGEADADGTRGGGGGEAAGEPATPEGGEADA